MNQRSTLGGLCLALLLAVGVSCTDEKSGSTGPVSMVKDALLPDRSMTDEVVVEFFADYEKFYANREFDSGGTLVVGRTADSDALNPIVTSLQSGREVCAMLFLKLTRLNPDFSAGPEIAKSWKFSEDRKELTFYLRDDIYWHDGVQTTAHDVKFTHERAKDPKVAWSAIKWKEHIEDVVVIDDTTVKFVFSKVYPYQLMDAGVGQIIPKHLLEDIPPEGLKNAEFNRNPVGNGPFKFRDWEDQQFVDIVANEKFYLGRPPLDRIIYKVVPDHDSLRLQLINGEVDFVQRMPPKFYKDLVTQPHLRPQVFPERGYTYLGWNTKNPLFASKKVRQAMTMAIDREEIIKALLFEFGQVARSPVSPITWGYNPDVPDFPFDLEKSKKLLAEEGWADTDGDGWVDKNGQKFSFTLKTNKGNQIREDLTVIIQDMLKQVGVEVTPQLKEARAFFDDMEKKQFDAGIAGWIVGLKMDLTTLWHTKSIDDKFNFCSYSNAEVDRLTDTAKFEMDSTKSGEMWKRAQSIIADDQPYTFLFIQRNINWVHRRFQNVQMKTVAWYYNLDGWWVPKDQRKFKTFEPSTD